MSEKKTVNALVSGGEASAGPPLGPALGPLGINILQVVNTINEKTKDFPGMKVPVKVEVDTETKQFTVEVGIPPTAALIFKESGVTKGSGTAGTNFVGNISMEGIVKISKNETRCFLCTNDKIVFKGNHWHLSELGYQSRG